MWKAGICHGLDPKSPVEFGFQEINADPGVFKGISYKILNTPDWTHVGRSWNLEFALWKWLSCVTDQPNLLQTFPFSSLNPLCQSYWKCWQSEMSLNVKYSTFSLTTRWERHGNVTKAYYWLLNPPDLQAPVDFCFLFPLQMADAMEMMILSILAPQLHCEWRLPSWQVALLTSVGKIPDSSCLPWAFAIIVTQTFCFVSPKIKSPRGLCRLLSAWEFIGGFKKLFIRVFLRLT